MSLACPRPISLQRAGSRASQLVRTSPLVPRGLPATQTRAPIQTEMISMATVASYLRKGAKRGPARRRLIVVTAVTAVFLGAVLITGCEPPPDTPKIIVIVASATA